MLFTSNSSERRLLKKDQLFKGYSKLFLGQMSLPPLKEDCFAMRKAMSMVQLYKAEAVFPEDCAVLEQEAWTIKA